jgi:hypothetical protein
MKPSTVRSLPCNVRPAQRPPAALWIARLSPLRPALGRVATKLGVALAISAVIAQVSAQPASSPVAQAPQTIALIAAVGDRIQWVRQLPQVGSNLENFKRSTLPVPGQGLNFAALRGLDEAFEQSEPQTRRVLLSFNPSPDDASRLSAAKGIARDELTLNLLRNYLGPMPERKRWSRIVAVTPKYVFGESSGMGSKLSGIGVYVQPLAGMNFDTMDSAPNEAVGNEVTWGPGEGSARTRSFSTRFVAPYFYFQIVTLDANTLEVLSVQARREYTKYWDPKSTAIDPEKQFTPEQLASSMERLVEKSVVKAIAGGSNVKVGPLQWAPGTERR